ncbi:beta strand repeat-containing protein [Acinetobacter rathckeae]|uniref:beta strand repeat-containing protein n=1 Tax=Acinetobacter rathckeae TaxID=2605272 RepID=UPI0018A2D17F|nr:DUF11 domain-containing protein [Acinetobacter rathckeae]MBF7687389.1 DUF11 domain-containing protein [Acinetobacter rathckeae]MBF7694790.1 DUF11 domain-containing protein [Acinetobacter rathckeae]
MLNQAQRLKLTQLATSMALVAGGVVFASTAQAAAPSAGTNISNIASASYTDSNGSEKSVTSNVVTTTVLQVASFTLEADTTQNANANGQVSISHTLTNTGNGSDTFSVAVANNDSRDNTTDNYDFNGLSVYLDANKDGIPDSQTPISQVTLAAGQSVNVIVRANTASTGVTAGDLGKLTVSAGSGVDTSLTKKNVDTVKITNGAVISLVKSASVQNVDPTASDASREVEYTLAYQNTGNTTATNVTITDVLPANLIYTAGSATLNGSSLSDASDADGYVYDSGKVKLVLPSVAANSSGVLKFKVKVVQNAPAGKITNVASVDPDGDNGPEGSTNSNSNDVTVMSIKKGTINDSLTDAFADGASTTTPTPDVVSQSTTQGTSISFGSASGEPIVVHNTGNVTESYNITVDKNTLPSGSVVELFKADGVTPLTDTNGDGVLDTGPIEKGGKYQVVAKVTLPSTYSTTTAVNAILTASPVSDSSLKDTIKLEVSKVTAATVDLSNGDATNSTGSTPGASGQDTAQYIDTKSTKPGQGVSFPLAVTNTGANADNYNLSTATDLPTGWTVQYYLADSSGNPTGSAITNTGNVPSNTTIKLVAVVTPAQNTPAGNQEVLFKVASPATGLTDVMSDRVVVETVRTVSLQNDRSGQIAPGGTVVYKHTLTNNSNIVESTKNLPFTLTNDQSSNGWVTSIFVDTNGNGIADSDELVTGSDFSDKKATLAIGESVNLLIKVQAPTNATAGTANAVTFTITPTDVNGQSAKSVTNTDLTTVTSGQVRLVKEQASVDCSTGQVSSGSYSQNSISAKPGTCVKYRITAYNEGNANVTNVVVSDSTPTYTTLKVINGVSPLATNATLTSSTTALTDGSTGTISAEKTPLVPNSNASLEFVIKVNN